MPQQKKITVTDDYFNIFPPQLRNYRTDIFTIAYNEMLRAGLHRHVAHTVAMQIAAVAVACREDDAR